LTIKVSNHMGAFSFSYAPDHLTINII